MSSSESSLYSSSESLQKAPNSPYGVFSLICEKRSHSMLESSCIPTWMNACRALTTNDHVAFKGCNLHALVNKIYIIYKDFMATTTICTLLDAVIDQGDSISTQEMIKYLLSAGAKTDSTYRIYVNEKPKDYYPPIYHAIMAENLAAFRLLWKANPTASLSSITVLWHNLPGLSEKPEAKDFLSALKEASEFKEEHEILGTKFPCKLPEPEKISAMLQVIADNPSCTLQ